MNSGADFDRGALHPAAADSFDRRGHNLLALFERRPPAPSPAEPFESRHEAEVIHAVSSDPVGEFCDASLQTTGWYFYDERELVALSGPGYRALRLLIEDIRRKAPFQHGFSQKFLEKAVIAWCRAYLTDETQAGLASHLLDACGQAHREHIYLVPLSHVEIERDFAIGDVRVITLSPKLFEEAARYARELHPQRESAGQSSEELGRRLANVPAVEVRTVGERRFARDRAFEVAGEVAGVLRFLSPASVSGLVPSPVHPLGHEPIPTIQMLRVDDSRLAGSETELLHIGLAGWKLSEREIERLTSGSLSNISYFFDGRTLNDFGNRVRHAFFGFCRAIGRYDAGDRLVGAISALEYLLIRDENEPLQYSVGDRLAFLTAHTRSDRIKAISTYKRAYSLRSGVVHRLEGIKEEEVADALFHLAFLAFYKAITGLSIFKTRDDFLNGLDHVKFGGTYGAEPRPAEPREA
jgi:hypothetical protein